MKVYFGFNDIRQDGMGSAAINLLTALTEQGIKVQPVHPWKKILVKEYMKFNPIFLTDSEEEPELKDVIQKMIDIVNDDPECTIFSHFGSQNWGAIVPYLRPDIKVVVSVHSITPSSLKIALANKNRTSLFIPVNWRIEKKLQKQFPKMKVFRIPNAIDTKQYPIHTHSDNKPIKIIFFGRIENYTKGCDRIPKIAKILKDKGLKFEWDFYGYFHWGYENKYYELNKAYGVDDVITYKGCVQPHEIPSTISKYDIMVMPSNHEGLPYVLIESMACGLVSVASLLKDVTDKIVYDGVDAFLVNKNDIKNFADIIYKAATDIELRKRIGANARKKIVDSFDIKEFGKRYKEAFVIAESDDTIYQTKHFSSETFKIPNNLKPHILARLIPTSIKTILKKYI